MSDPEVSDNNSPALIVERARAKINLNLQIKGRREDGYHVLESLVAFVESADILTFSKAERVTLTLSGPFAADLQDEQDNLVLQAARALCAGIADFPAGAHITLEKNLPVSSGIGGGSADAAATIRGLLRLNNIDLSPAGMVQTASFLGADVPVCLLSRAAFISGTGTMVEPMTGFPEIYTVLVNPNIPVSTNEVYQALGLEPGTTTDEQSPAHAPGPFFNGDDLIDYLCATPNDLEPAAALMVREIGDILEALFAQSGCLLARMSGSGATCFGLFDDHGQALLAAQAIKAQSPGFWVVHGRLS